MMNIKGKPERRAREPKRKAAVENMGFWRRNRLSGGYLLRQKAGNIIFIICRSLLVFGLCFLILQPLFNKISVSFMQERDLYDSTVISVPRNPTLENYRVMDELISYWNSMFNTLWICFLVSLLQVATCTLAGYGFARFNFPLKKLWFACVMLAIVVPTQTILAPLYLNFRFFDVFGIFRLAAGAPINLLDNVAGLILIAVTGMGLKSGLYIFMLRQYFRGVPQELDEAALVDGCGRFKTFTRIMLPDAMPMITSCFLFSFVWQWTDSLYSAFFLKNHNVLPFALGGLADRLAQYYTRVFQMSVSVGYTQAIIATGALVCLVPLIILYLFAQRAFVESLSQTGIKM